MSLSADQRSYYFVLWNQVCAVRGINPKDRTARQRFHLEHQLPESSTRWGDEEMDVFVGRCLAIIKPADLGAQLRAADQPCNRRRWRIGQLLKALGRGPEYIAVVVRRINDNTLHEPQIVRLYETMTPRELDRILFDLQRESRAEQGQKHIPF